MAMPANDVINIVKNDQPFGAHNVTYDVCDMLAKCAAQTHTYGYPYVQVSTALPKHAHNIKIIWVYVQNAERST